jgi:hypothetical protein
MPANKFTKALYKSGTIKAEKAAMANRDPARARRAMESVAREGTTSAAGGRAAVKMPKPVQVTRTTVMMKPTPTKKK